MIVGAPGLPSFGDTFCSDHLIASMTFSSFLFQPELLSLPSGLLEILMVLLGRIRTQTRGITEMERWKIETFVPYASVIFRTVAKALTQHKDRHEELGSARCGAVLAYTV